MTSTERKLNNLVKEQGRFYSQMTSETDEFKRQNAMIAYTALERKIERIMQEE